MKKQLFTTGILFITLTVGVIAQDLVEWRGVNRTGIYDETGLLKSWPETGPQLLNELENLGNGYSTPVVYNNTIIVTGRKDSTDVVSAFSMNGEKKWETIYGRAWVRTYPETRSTPTVENDRIYLVSGMGEVSCVDATSGKLIWMEDANSKYAGEPHRWGIAESVAISDKAVFYVTGGNESAVVALDKINGQLIWKSKSLGGSRAYASSLIIEKSGLKILLAQTAKDLLAINTENGEIIWSIDLMQYHTGQQGKGANTNTPLFFNDEIFITSGYNHPAVMLKLADDGKSVKVKWTNPDFDNHMGGVVKIGNYIYGSNWLNNANGNWICIDWNTGKTMYEKNWFNKGPIISADGMLYCLDEKNGNLGLVDPNAESFNLVSSFRIEKGEGPYWAHPSIYDGKLFVRHGNVLMIYDIKE